MILAYSDTVAFAESIHSLPLPIPVNLFALASEKSFFEPIP